MQVCFQERTCVRHTTNLHAGNEFRLRNRQMSEWSFFVRLHSIDKKTEFEGKRPSLADTK